MAVVAVCFGGSCSSTEADVMSRVLIPRDYGVKLCGREFIRAVIFTCGGSRWRRASERNSDPFQWSSFNDITLQDKLQTWQHGAELTDKTSPVQISSYSLADLLTLFGLLGDRKLTLSDPIAAEKLQQLQRFTVLDEQDGNAAGYWPKTSRKKRNFSLGMAGMCCSQGCTKNDIGQLC
ncbi:hypothetical protein LDENG_00155640 [Lucifuga dentata]|nr:hypothetical protein LDENG_00155640 [Lucifuga dentata]